MLKMVKIDLNKKFVFAEMKKIISHNPNSLFLDMGCGENHLSKFKNVEGYDIALRKNYYKKPKIYDGKHLPEKNNKYDFIIHSSVLEHVQDQDQHLEELKRVLKKNGIIFLFIPTPFFYVSRIFSLSFLKSIFKGNAFIVHGRSDKFNSIKSEKKSWTTKYYDLLFKNHNFNVIFYQKTGNIFSFERRLYFIQKYLKNTNLKNGALHYYIIQNNK